MKTPSTGQSWAIVILAGGLSVALNLIVIGVVWDAIYSEGPGLSANATQVLLAWGGGVIGIIGAYVGYRVGVSSNGTTPTDQAGTDGQPDAPTDAGSGQGAQVFDRPQ